MAQSFTLEILTPAKEICREPVTEVILPAYDGETGVLPNHGDFIGVLGTGVLKLVREGNDYWFLVSSGIYEVKDGVVTIFADLAEPDSVIDVAQAEKDKAYYTELLAGETTVEPEQFEEYQQKLKLAEARLEVNRRTTLIN